MAVEPHLIAAVKQQIEGVRNQSTDENIVVRACCCARPRCPPNVTPTHNRPFVHAMRLVVLTIAVLPREYQRIYGQ
jgi:hypothetical protein